MRRWAFDDAKTVEHNADTSGVHAADTRPAPYLEEYEQHRRRLIGSIPIEDLSADFEPIVNLYSGETRGYEVLPRCRREGLNDLEELFARATFEKTVGELGRAIRRIAVRDCAGSPLYFSVHPGELKERYLVLPDDPVHVHDAPVYLQLSQPSLTGVGALVLGELGGRSGVSLAIDNFGAGAATLMQLVELEPAVVKIDRDLVSGIDRSLRKQVVVRSLASTCEQLGARLIAKGVDFEAELATLLECGIVYGQGRALGEPAPLPAI